MTTEKDFLADLEQLSGVTPEKLSPFWIGKLGASRLIVSDDERWFSILYRLRQVLYTVVPSHHIKQGDPTAYLSEFTISDEAVAFLNVHAQTIVNLTMIAHNDEQHTSTHLT